MDENTAAFLDLWLITIEARVSCGKKRVLCRSQRDAPTHKISMQIVLKVKMYKIEGALSNDGKIIPIGHCFLGQPHGHHLSFIFDLGRDLQSSYPVSAV